jgi:hypothetical protein
MVKRGFIVIVPNMHVMNFDQIQPFQAIDFNSSIEFQFLPHFLISKNCFVLRIAS